MFRKQFLSFVSLVLLLAFLITSCKKEDSNVGLDVIPEKYKVTSITDTLEVVAYTIPIDTLVTSGASKLFLGSIDDFIFGKTEASFVFEFFPDDSIVFDGYTIDSMYLNLNIDTSYIGNGYLAQEFNYSSIDTAALWMNTKYYSNTDIASLNPEVQFSSQFIAESPFAADTSLENTQSFKIPGDYINDIIINSSNRDLYPFYSFPFYVKPGSDTEGVISTVNVAGSSNGAIIYYSDTLEYSYKIGSLSRRFNIFEHDYSQGNIVADLTNPESKQDSVVYIQGFGGLRAKIYLPTLDDKIDDGNLWAVNKAQLILPLEDTVATNTKDFPAPTKLYIWGLDSDGSYTYIDDYYAVSSTGESTYYGATYNDGKYVFTLTKYVQNILLGLAENNGFIITVGNEGTDNSRVVLTSGIHSNNMKLVLTLTDINQN